VRQFGHAPPRPPSGLNIGQSSPLGTGCEQPIRSPLPFGPAAAEVADAGHGRFEELHPGISQSTVLLSTVLLSTVLL